LLAQFAGAAGGYVVVNQFVQAYPTNEMTAQGLTLFQATLIDTDHWRPFFAEALGALFVGFALAAVVLNRKSGTEASLTIGLAFLGGLTVALLGSAGVLNPAVALSMGTYQLDNFWTITQYALGPVAGVVIGALAYKLLKWDVTGGKVEE
jgi:glycerol uptake facilitator-like aquaporin